MPKFVGKQKKSLGRGSLYAKARKTVLSRSQMCWICLGEAASIEHAPFVWEKLPFDSAAIDMSKQWPDPASPSVDHEIPISMLGAEDPRLWRVDFLHPAHLKCNSARGDGRYRKEIATKTSRNWLA